MSAPWRDSPGRA
ncbi:TPA_asm: UL52.5 sORF 1 [Human alphaherpesvirus 1]|nr:TPA_asm: UL52.5 sORF 1 [Human alphaherpesvirus 1]